MGGAISQDQFGRNFVVGGSQKHLYTIWLKLPESKRGEYAEEIDVMARSAADARSIASQVLKVDYIPQLRITKITQIW